METTIEARKEQSSFVMVVSEQPEAETIEWMPGLESLFPKQSNIPLRRPQRSVEKRFDSIDEVDAHLARIAIDEGDFVPYEDFRKELGMGK
jgi:hypothetical protein